MPTPFEALLAILFVACVAAFYANSCLLEWSRRQIRRRGRGHR